MVAIVHSKDKRIMTTLRILAVVLALTPGLRAFDVLTLDGKIYRNCTVSLVEPDAICVLYPGGGARVKFFNLPESLRIAYGYDPMKAAAFEQTQALKRRREDARWQLARVQAETQRKAAASNFVARAQAASSTSPVREVAAYGGRNQGQGGYGGNGQNSSSGTGSEYVGVSLASAGNSYSGQGGGGYGSAGGRNQGGGFGGGTGATYIGVRLVP
jgi:hypothetical protein